MKKKIYILMYVILLLFMLWVLASFINVNLHNKFGDYEYWTLNFFTLVFQKYMVW